MFYYSQSSKTKKDGQQFTRFQLGRDWDAESILSLVNQDYELLGSRVVINGIAALDKAREKDLSFCSAEGQAGSKLIANSNAGIILCSKGLKGSVVPKAGSQQLVFLDNPRLVFVHFANISTAAIQSNNGSPLIKGRNIAGSAVIDKTAEIGSNCIIGEFVKIGANCILEDNVVIGEHSTLVQNCRIGENSILQPGVILGADGFAFERHDDGRLEKFPHFAGVIIGKDVVISSNCSIARGSLNDTIIEDSTKIDALVHIAHNVKIGKNCQLTAGTIIGGSTTVGDNCWTGLNSTLKNKVKVGNRVLVAAGACVITDVLDDDIVGGVPARSIKRKVNTKEISLMVSRKTEFSNDMTDEVANK